MMKSFFKKLAFVMALAMVVTMAAPAAAKAYAAGMYLAYQGKKAAVSEINLKAGSSEDLCFKNAPANWAELSKTWASDNEAVAVVDKNGVVTAVADGTAKITFTLGDGTAASVTVNVGEAKVYDVVLGTAKDNTFAAAELKTGATLDLNFYGIKDWAAGKYSCTWISNAPEVAKVDQKGVVTAVAAGTATVSIALVNNESGATMNVTPVVVTVPEEKVAETFTVKQTSTDTFVLTFDSADVAKKVTADNLTTTMLVGTVEMTTPIKSLAVKDEKVTVVLFGDVTDGFTYRFDYNGNVQEYVASIGDIAHASFTYWTDKSGDGKAYVATDEEDATVKLAYTLYDENGVNVTSRYTEVDATFELVTESESVDFDSEGEVVFEKAGAYVINLTVAWEDAEGDEHQTPVYTGVVVAENRPALTLTYVNAGLIKSDDYGNNDGPDTNFLTKKGVFWKSNLVKNTWIYGDDDSTLLFAGLFKDNRGNDVVTGNTKYGYGKFSFDSSDKDVLTVDSDGTLNIYEAGTAVVLIYFTNTMGEEDVTTLVGTKKVTVYPERVPTSYELNTKSVTIGNAGSTVAGNFTVTVYDQYNEKIDLVNELADIVVKAKDEENLIGLTASRENTGIYHFAYDGSKYDLDGEDYDTFSYTLEVDPDDENSTLKGGSATLKVKVYDVADDVKSVTALKDKKYYYNHAANDKAGEIDAYVNFTNNYVRDWYAPEISKSQTTWWKESAIWVNYENSKGLTLAPVAKDNIIELEKDQKTGEAGKIYYEVSAPSDKNWTLTVEDGKLDLTFNTTTNGEKALEYNGVKYTDGFGYAANGNYKITLKYVKNTSADDKGIGKLSELETYTYTVKNSQPEMKWADFDSKLGNKTEYVTDGKVDADKVAKIVAENFKFSFDGATNYVGKFGNVEVVDIICENRGNNLRVTSMLVKIELEVPFWDTDNYGEHFIYQVVKINKTVEPAK